MYGPVADAEPPRSSIHSVVKTTDGGQSWHILQDGEGYSSKDVHFLDEQTGFAAGQTVTNTSYMGTTMDGGKTWQWDTFYSEIRLVSKIFPVQKKFPALLVYVQLFINQGKV